MENEENLPEDDEIETPSPFAGGEIRRESLNFVVENIKEIISESEDLKYLTENGEEELDALINKEINLYLQENDITVLEEDNERTK